ncbi:MAG: lytic transglycosylase domain-containing protein, partial [Longimicrobiales bacterium]
AAAMAGTATQPATPVPGAEQPDNTGVGVEADAAEPSWDMPVTRNDQVDFFIEFLMGKNRDKTQLWLERTGRYGPLIREELRKAGMPEDLLYLAMIESGLDPNAYSKAHAAGIWQFIAPTGQRYGLEVSDYVDERRDPVKATRAALTYLKELNERFGGSWYLAAAGYNTGENRVDRILREQLGGARGDENLFWQIMDLLPRETRDYVPVMLAMGHIAKEPAKYGFDEVRLQQPLDFREVRVPAGTKLDDIAHAAGVPADQVTELNPHLVRGMTPPDRDWNVRVPLGTETRVAAQFQSGPPTASLAD